MPDQTAADLVGNVTTGDEVEISALSRCLLGMACS